MDERVALNKFTNGIVAAARRLLPRGNGEDVATRVRLDAARRQLHGVELHHRLYRLGHLSLMRLEWVARIVLVWNDSESRYIQLIDHQSL